MADSVQALASETALQTVHDRVYAPCFFAKLASDYGIAPANADEETAMAHFREKLGGAAPAQDDLIKAAARECASDQELAHAVLSLQRAVGQA
jgi:hypothetical protein